MDCSPPGSSVQGILQARMMEWVAIPSSGRSSWPREWTNIFVSPTLAGTFFTTSATWEALGLHWFLVKRQARTTANLKTILIQLGNEFIQIWALILVRYSKPRLPMSLGRWWGAHEPHKLSFYKEYYWTFWEAGQSAWELRRNLPAGAAALLARSHLHVRGRMSEIHWVWAPVGTWEHALGSTTARRSKSTLKPRRREA